MATLHSRAPQTTISAGDFNVNSWPGVEHAQAGFETPSFNRVGVEEARRHELQEWAHHYRLHHIQPRSSMQVTHVADIPGSSGRILDYVWYRLRFAGIQPGY